MRISRTLFVALGASALMAGSTLAADLVVDVPMVDEVMSDWTGAYAGIGLGGTIFSGPATVSEAAASVELGFNVQSGQFLFGAEAFLAGYVNDFPDNGAYVGAEIRGGLLATPDVLLYGSLGGLARSSGRTYVTAGVGAEFKVMDDMSIDLEYKHWWDTAAVYQANSITASLLWHF